MLFEALNTTKVFHDNDVLFLNTEEINIEYSPLMFLLSWKSSSLRPICTGKKIYAYFC